MTGAKPNGLIGKIARHANAANIIMVAMMLFGLYGLSKLNTQFFPTVKIETVTVSVAWPGASTEDVISNIIEVMEPELRFLDQLSEITSYGREGSATISLEFEEGADTSKALSDVEQAVAGVTTLPLDAEEPVVSASEFSDSVATLAIGGPFPEETLKSFAAEIRDDLIDRGIDKVEVFGYRAPEYFVEIPEWELFRSQTTVADLTTRVSDALAETPSGNLTGETERQIRVLPPEVSEKTISNIEVSSYLNGEKVRVSDLATVIKGFDEDADQGFSAGQRSIRIRVLRAENTDTLESAAILNSYLAERTETFPRGLSITRYNVTSDIVAGRIDLLVNNGLTGLVLVVGILFVFLNARIAFWVAAGIPIAVITTFGVMWLTGQSINMISLFALIMMLGVIVDDAIVVGEHTATRKAMGDTPKDAAVNGAKMMLTPIMAASFTTVAAFLPILLLGDVLGQIMAALTIVVIAVVVASLIECFLILPGHLAHAFDGQEGWSWRRVALVAITACVAGLLSGWVPNVGILLPVVACVIAFICELIFSVIRASRRKSGKTGWAVHARGGIDTAFENFRDGPFRAFVVIALNWRYVTLAVAVAAMLITTGLVRGGRVGFTFFPSPESERVSASVFFHPGTVEKDVVNGVLKIEAALQGVERELSGSVGDLVVASFVTIGSAGNNRGDNMASISVQLTKSEDRDVRTPEFVQAWKRALPDVAGISKFSISEERGGPPGRDLDIRITGPGIDTLKKAAGEIQKELAVYPGTSGVEDDLPFGKPEVRLSLNERGTALGFTEALLGRQVRAAIQGDVADRFAEGDEEVAIRVRLESNGGGLSSLMLLPVSSPNGEIVTISEIADMVQSQGYSVVLRRAGETVVSVVADVDSTITSSSEIISDLSRSFLPKLQDRYGIDYSFAGRAEEQSGAFSELLTGTGLAVIAIYLILALVFGSYSMPIVVMSIIPFGIVGAIFGHYVMGFDVTILSLIGLLGLSGILVNNSIILVARFSERVRTGQDVGTAAIGSSCDRLRAVLLTSITTIGGLLPLMFETSLQAQFLLPMAITIVFGLASATVLVLVLVPALLKVGDDIATLVRTNKPETAF